MSSAVDCRVINNTFYNCGQATIRVLTTSVLYPLLSGNIVENNIFAFGASAYINGGVQPAGAVSFSNNIYYSIINSNFNGPYWDTPDLDAIKDPNPITYGSTTSIFLDGPNYDFHLITGSPAIGSGKAETEPLYDYYGKAFFTPSRSIGAIESDISTGVKYQDGVFLNDDVNIYPNPAADYLNVDSKREFKNIMIYDILGIKKIEFTSKSRIYIGSLDTGTYFLNIDGNMYKFVKL